MAADAIVRPLAPADVVEADAVAWAALREQIPAMFHPTPAEDGERARRGRARISHLQATDPEGAWVAEVDGRIAAVALAVLREGLWGLSLFAVRPSLQGRGLGARTLAGALRHGQGRRRGRIILSSNDPRALRRYVRAGLRVRPCLDAAGAANRSRLPAGLRATEATVADEQERLDAISRHVRGAAHGGDLAVLEATGGHLLVLGDRGFAFHRGGSPVLLAARDDGAATDLLWSCLAAAGAGVAVNINFISAGNDWAAVVALDAGLALSPDGPIFADGETGPLAPYLPSGAYL